MRISDWSADVCSSDLNQDRIGHHALAVLQHDAAVVADGDDRPDQMLVHAHAAGDAVHDDAETLHDWKCSCCIMVCPAGPDAGRTAEAKTGTVSEAMLMLPSRLFRRPWPSRRSYRSSCA